MNDIVHDIVIFCCWYNHTTIFVVFPKRGYTFSVFRHVVLPRLLYRIDAHYYINIYLQFCTHRGNISFPLMRNILVRNILQWREELTVIDVTLPGNQNHNVMCYAIVSWWCASCIHIWYILLCLRKTYGKITNIYYDLKMKSSLVT